MEERPKFTKKQIWFLFMQGYINDMESIQLGMTRREFEKRWGRPVDWERREGI